MSVTVRSPVSGEALRFEDEVASLDRVFDIFASRIGSESNPRVAIVFTDITQRKRAEAEREEMLGREQVLRRGAEDANRAKDEFLAMLSHELRSPLNVILGWTQILEDRDFDRDTTQQAMAIIARNVRLQNALIEDLLDVSRIISGKMQLETENVSLVALVRECLDAALPSAEKKAIALESNLDENAGEMLGDKHCLQQIFGNLLTNAIKFTPENGRIEVTLKRIGDRAQLSIEDSGIGIAPELLPQIFERFKQADASSKRQFGGLGLGLTIVKHLAQLHGGDVSAHSDGEGRGATFTVELPLAVKAVAKNENAEESRARENLKPLAGLRVLVVDDDRDALELMQFVLQHKGATVSCASSASAASRKLDGESFDLLISDLGMPHMDGFDLIRAVRANGHADLPAIALTGYVSAEDRERVVRAGFQAHLPKPVNVENLFAAALNFARK